MARTRLVAVVVSALTVAVVVVFPNHTERPAVGVVAVTAATPDPAPRPCDWREEWDRTLAELGEDPKRWFRVTGDLMHGYLGRTVLASGHVYIDPATPCEHLADVIRHEHLHLQQARAHGPRGALEHYGDRLEIVADCGSWLLGSTYTPYRDEAAPGCTPRDLADARLLLTSEGRRGWSPWRSDRGPTGSWPRKEETWARSLGDSRARSTASSPDRGTT